MQFEIKTNGQPWDKNSFIAQYVQLLIDFKSFATNTIDWIQARDSIQEHIKYLKDYANIDLIIEDKNE